MLSSRKFIYYLPNLLKLSSRKNEFALKKYKRYFCLSASLLEDNSKSQFDLGSIATKYEKFSDEKSPIIYDVEEERRKAYEVNDDTDNFKEKKSLIGIDCRRGKTGVLDVEELTELLIGEKALDILVIKIPDTYAYANYMVIATGKSERHMKAIITFIRQVYKCRVNGQGMIPDIEGKSSKDWKAIDIGNIVLHVFSAPAREHYDVETLWSVDKEFDSLSRTVDKEESSSSNQIFLTDFNHMCNEVSPATNVNVSGTLSLQSSA